MKDELSSGARRMDGSANEAGVSAFLRTWGPPAGGITLALGAVVGGAAWLLTLLITPQLNDVQTSLQNEIEDVRASLQSNIEDVRTSLQNEIDQVEARMSTNATEHDQRMDDVAERLARLEGLLENLNDAIRADVSNPQERPVAVD